MPLELRLPKLQLLWVIFSRERRPLHFHEAGRAVEVDCAAMRRLRHSPAMRNFHRHQQRIARFEAHTPAANFGDEFASQNIEPLVLLVMHVKRRTAVRMMLSDREHICRQPTIGVRGSNYFGVEHP